MTYKGDYPDFLGYHSLKCRALPLWVDFRAIRVIWGITGKKGIIPYFADFYSTFWGLIDWVRHTPGIPIKDIY